VFCETLYRFWDDLVKAKPGLLIDNCAGGGSRLDVELISRSLPYWRSDSYCHIGLDTLKYARLNQLITCNLNYYIPWSIAACMAKTPYDMRSGFNTGLDFVDDGRSGDFHWDDLEKALEECKRLRKYHLGNFYVIAPPDDRTDSMCAWQYHRPEEEDGYAVVFRREDCPFNGIDLPMQSIDEDAEYRISLYETYDLKETRTVSGRLLRSFEAHIGEKPGSLLIEYAKVK
ncbi:MAG: alpha-galactosidase, partial [Abditibacteriota bacterium]|nr:alpha-galactosidase [Abditibacteriota bacterium]